MAPILEPYLTLARNLGEFLGQVEDLQPKRIEVQCAGEVANLPSAPIVNAALAGLLAQFFEFPVNQVNAPMVAKDGGIDVRSEKTSRSTEFSTQVAVSVVGTDDQRVSVSGTLATDRTPRLVRWGQFEMEAVMAGAVLVTRNEDAPGVIGAIGTVLGEAGINVSSMQMGLDSKTREAAALWALSTPVSDAVLGRIRDNKYVKSAYAVRLS
jgi:D-3-phosphoglycerate dehydrogenase